MKLYEWLWRRGLARSKADGKRLIAQGAVRANGHVVDDMGAEAPGGGEAVEVRAHGEVRRASGAGGHELEP